MLVETEEGGDVSGKKWKGYLSENVNGTVLYDIIIVSTCPRWFSRQRRSRILPAPVDSVCERRGVIGLSEGGVIVSYLEFFRHL